jgi:hypothetical protein
MEWKDMISQKPYSHWEEMPKAALLRWLQVEVMKYKDEELKVT